MMRRVVCVLAVGALCAGLGFGQAVKKEMPTDSTGLAPVGGQVVPQPPQGGGIDYGTSWVYGENAIANPPSAVKFQVSTPATLITIGPDGVPAGNFLSAGTFANGIFSTMYCLDYGTSHLWLLDTATGVATDQGACTPPSGSWTGFAFDYSSGVFYATSTTCGSSTLCRIDVSTRQVTTIGDMGAPCIIAAAIDCAGNMYADEIVNDTFGRVDKNTGAYTVIGPLGFNANYAQGMVVDHSDGTVYLTAYNLGTGMAEWRSVDVNTGNTTLLGPIGAGTGVELALSDVAEGCGPPVPGACCNDTTGACTENILPADCSAQHGRYGGPNSTCATINPPCLAHGACCMPGNQCTNNQTPAGCQAAGGRFAGAGTVCAQLIYVQGTGGAWQDISGTGTHATSAEVDDGGAAYPIGFTFNFYGVDKTQVGICSNGYLTFGTTYTVYVPSPIPHTSQPTDQIAPFWRDLYPSPTNHPGAAVQYQTFGSAPNRYMIVQWTNAPAFPNTGSNTFQVALYETTNRIEFRYQAFDATGYQAGVENAAGTIGTNVTSAVAPNTSLSLTPQPSGPDPCAGCRGDINCDGQISIADINPFVAILAGQQQPCNAYNADVNGDGQINFADINPFVQLLSGGGHCN